MCSTLLPLNVLPLVGLQAGLVLTIGQDAAPAQVFIVSTMTIDPHLTMVDMMEIPQDRARFTGIYKLLSDSGNLFGPLIVGNISQVLYASCKVAPVAMCAVHPLCCLLMLVPIRLLSFYV